MFVCVCVCVCMELLLPDTKGIVFIPYTSRYRG